MAKNYNNIRSLIKEKNWKALKTRLNQLDTIQISYLIEEIPYKEGIIIFRLLNRIQSKEVFHQLSHSEQNYIIEGLAKNKHKLSDLLNDLEPDDRTAFFEELPGEVTQKLIQFLSPEERDITTQLLGYPEQSIGRLMTPEYVAVKPHFTIEQAFDHIRKFGSNSETLNVIYIVDEKWKLIDDLKIKDIILTDPQLKISDIMDNRFVSLDVYQDQEHAIKIFSDYDRVALPVINSDGVLLGIVSIDDIMDVAEEESTEDFHKFGSFKSAITDPLNTRIFSLYKNRIVWLLLLVFMNVFSGAALSSFESIISSVVSLIFFLPLIIDSGGNAGSQSATLMIRSLAIGDVELGDWYKLIGKEVVVSLLLGFTMALGVAAIASFRAPEIILVVSATMMLNVLAGSLIGMILPFIFTRLKMDPATASAPLITSIADICGVTIYFSIATWWLG